MKHVSELQGRLPGLLVHSYRKIVGYHPHTRHITGPERIRRLDPCTALCTGDAHAFIQRGNWLVCTIKTFDLIKRVLPLRKWSNNPKSPAEKYGKKSLVPGAGFSQKPTRGGCLPNTLSWGGATPLSLRKITGYPGWAVFGGECRPHQTQIT